MLIVAKEVILNGVNEKSGRPRSLAGNMSELTTEHSSKEKNPCVLRGGWYGNTAWTAYRASGTTVAIGCSFRAGVWVRKFE